MTAKGSQASPANGLAGSVLMMS